MYTDTNVYDESNLTEEDEKCYNAIAEITDKILSDDVIEEYISEHYHGETISSMMKEFLEAYTVYLKEHRDFLLSDWAMFTAESKTN